LVYRCRENDYDHCSCPCRKYLRGANERVECHFESAELEFQNVERVRIPTYLAESMTRKIVLPRDIGVPGDVVLELLVGRNGRVLKAQGVSGNSVLISAAKPAMMKWVFSPFFLDGKPVQFLTKLTVQFDGKKGSARLKVEADPLATLNQRDHSETLPRLAAIKRRFDPENVFRRNLNVAPGLSGQV